MEGQGHTKFSRWLEAQLDAKQMTRRGLARAMAARHPRGETIETIETYRRALYKYLREGSLPSQPMRAAIAEALGVAVGEIPEEDEDSELPLSRSETNQLFSLLGKAMRVRT